MTFRSSLILLSLVLSVLLPTMGSAQDRQGVVLDFSGRGGSSARNAVVRALRGEIELVSRNRARDTASDLGVNLDSRRGIAAVAGELGLSYVVRGSVSGRGRQARTEIRILNSEGEEIAFKETGSARGRAGRLRVGAASLEALEEARIAVVRQEEEDARIAALDEEAPPGMGDDYGDDEDEDEDDATPSEPGALPVAIGIIGVNGRNRNARVELGSGANRTYNAKMFMELTLHGEFHPLARKNNAASGLYLQVDLNFALGLASRECPEAPMVCDATTTREIPTNAYRMMFQVGYLLPIQNAAYRVGVLLGFGYDAFVIEANSTLPSATYPQVRAGLAGAFNLAGRIAQLRIDVAYRAVFGVGLLADSFGIDATARGFDFSAGVQGIMDMGLTYNIHVGLTQYSHAYSGAAIDTEALSGRDRHIFVGAGLGYAFY